MTVTVGGRVKRIRLQRERRNDGLPPPPHWRCPDCGQPCSCSGDIRLFNLPHQPCGLTKEST